MTRLQTERDRLYAPPADAPPRTLRTLLLEIVAPMDWAPLGRLWQGVQAELGLPAPAIAVSGRDALQFWFSLAAPVDAAQGEAFLEGLRRRYLAELPPRRVRVLTSAAGVPAVPAPQPDSGLWSAFVAPDLAPLFTETPWLDMPPGDEGQAQLLATLTSIAPADWAAALASLQPGDPSHPAPDMPRVAHTADEKSSIGGPAAEGDDPVAFLRAVMRDRSVPLALRVEAAKALLPAATPPRD